MISIKILKNIIKSITIDLVEHIKNKKQRKEYINRHKHFQKVPESMYSPSLSSLVGKVIKNKNKYNYYFNKEQTQYNKR